MTKGWFWPAQRLKWISLLVLIFSKLRFQICLPNKVFHQDREPWFSATAATNKENNSNCKSPNFLFCYDSVSGPIDRLIRPLIRPSTSRTQLSFSKVPYRLTEHKHWLSLETSNKKRFLRPVMDAGFKQKLSYTSVTILRGLSSKNLQKNLNYSTNNGIIGRCAPCGDPAPACTPSVRPCPLNQVIRWLPLHQLLVSFQFLLSGAKKFKLTKFNPCIIGSV